jgi:hypothetical protein
MARTSPATKAVIKAIKAAGFNPLPHICSTSFKVYDDSGVEFACIDIQRSAHEDKVRLLVDATRDGAGNYRALVESIHGLVVRY